MTVREAQWAVKLHGRFDHTDEMEMRRHLRMAALYASRERLNLEVPGPEDSVYTSDLDSILMFRPWISLENSQEYERRSPVSAKALMDKFHAQIGLSDRMLAAVVAGSPTEPFYTEGELHRISEIMELSAIARPPLTPEQRKVEETIQRITREKAAPK